MAALEWLPFNPSVLARARQEDRPILLVITVPWCAHSKRLLHDVLANDSVTAEIAKGFLGVQVDAERRPDINGRYGTGGWPTIAYLTPNAELIAHHGFVAAEELVTRLQKVQAYFTEHGDSIDEQARDLFADQDKEPASTGRELDERILTDVGDAIHGTFDRQHGGWGDKAKFPHSEAIDYALVQMSRGDDPRMAEIVEKTLNGMMEGSIHDPIDGGFFRFSRTPDWQTPNHEKVLGPNARRLRCYLEGFQLTGNGAWRLCAQGILRWMLTFMRDPETGAFYGSQYDDPDYYALGAEARKRHNPPGLDRTIFTNMNAITVSSLLKASVVLERPELVEWAMGALRFLLKEMHDPQRGVYHYWDGTYHLPGMLVDQAYMIRALVDAAQHTGDADLLLPAESIAELAIKRQRSSSGGFYDILEDPRSRGSMGRRNRSILENAVMAEALVRLGYLAHRPEFRVQAEQTLVAFRDAYREYGFYVAGYGRAVDLLLHPPLFVTIVGPRESEASGALRRAAMTRYIPSRIVQTLDPERDPILLERAGLESHGEPRAYVRVGDEHAGVADSPEGLLKALDDAEAKRRG